MSFPFPVAQMETGAELLLSGEAQGLAIDFTDAAFLGLTGFYGSARVIDNGTPANNYDSHPYGLLTYTSPSVKMCRGPDGLFRYGAHNLYLNSASPANQSVTVVSGATYAITITGSVSITWSDAYAGTTNSPGTTTFTAASGTLTGGSTSGSGTVQVRRTPSVSNYLATAGAVRYALPMEWDASGNPLGILCEEARTNLLLYSNDLTNAAWTKANATAALTATGPTGVANSASTVTASSDNGVAFQSVASASAAQSGSVFLKRRTGSGAVSIAIGETTGSELIPNADFATNDTSAWVRGARSVDGTLSMAGGVLTYTIGAGDAASPRYVRPISVTANTWYRAEVGSISGTAASRYFFAAKYSDGSGSISTSSANVPVYIFAPGTTLYIGIGATGSAGTTTILDNVSLQQVVESTIDLSSGLWVRGTIENKTIVNPILGIKLATNGDAVDVWCADLESGAFATSPIEAFGAQVTRAVDVLTLADSKAPWNTSVMSICAKVLQKSTLPTTGYRLAFEQQESGNTIFDLRFIDTNEITCAYGTGTGVGWLVDAVDVPNAGSMYKIAFSSGVASNYLYVNGAQCASANSSYSGTSGVTMSFGNGATPTRSLCGYLQNITLVPRKWSTAELQAKTS